MHQVLTDLGLTAKISEFPKVNTRELEIYGEELAQKISGKTPIIYSSDQLSALAKSWKIKINENTKTPAFCNFFPELNHNEMIGYTNPKGNFHVLMLMERNLHPRIEKRMKITSALIQEKGVPCEMIRLKGTGYLDKVMHGLVLGDWVAYYLACEYGQDPTPMEMVDELKSRLK
jgi:glucose/mannose-6-phosphate isomerase